MGDAQTGIPGHLSHWTKGLRMNTHFFKWRGSVLMLILGARVLDHPQALEGMTALLDLQPKQTSVKPSNDLRSMRTLESVTECD